MLATLTSNSTKRKRMRGITHEAKTMSDRYRELNDERFDVIVVGAGTGGLTAATILARRAKKSWWWTSTAWPAATPLSSGAEATSSTSGSTTSAIARPMEC